MKHYKVSLVVGTVVILASGWMRFASTSDVKISLTESASLEKNNFTKPESAPQQLLDSAVKVSVKPQISQPSQPQIQPREQQLQPLVTQLKQLRLIKAKVFRSETEEITMKAFVRNADNLQSLVSLLTDSVSLQATTAAEHQAAVDILLEAAKGANTKLAVESILTVIGDKQVEDQSSTKTVRELHAGIKAELMYGAAFIDRQTIQNYVPGPVTQKIWDNVQMAHAENITGSENQRKIYALPSK